MPVTLCPNCHHRPSMRDGDPAYCYCKCHDVADAAPDLLAECRRIHDRIAQDVKGPLPVTEREHDDYVRLARIISKAEGK